MYKNLYKNMHLKKANEKNFNENSKSNNKNRSRKSFLFQTSLLSSHSKEIYPINSSARFIIEFQKSLSSQKQKEKYPIHSVKFNLEKEKDSSLSPFQKDSQPVPSSIRLESDIRKSYSHNMPNSDSDTNLNISNFFNKNKNHRIKKNYKLTFKARYSNESSSRYMNEFNDYLSKAQKLKKECPESDNNRKTRLIKLDENKLVLEIKKKKNKTVNNSFGVRGRNNDDDDLNFESYKDVKKFHIDMGMGAFYMNNLKMKIEPRYIKKEFKKKTIQKYKGNKGVFFGTKFREKVEDSIKKKYK